ncbi:hypothetical protein DLAC_11401 [Tieghemostelium lacteum]|uniref:F-box domain-containing protein n=1 Tax=Tieghemostelium lacteum TaxID=361077 RepID=A0A151Z2G3_TIELA|nr:hypothetical protein DLAC_11401 [Tieghemostelium lacteum]|eukprot:KYQ88151.1 hypothetical protein DLAC_11401 [Tieghemostelium lacteum]
MLSDSFSIPSFFHWNKSKEDDTNVDNVQKNTEIIDNTVTFSFNNSKDDKKSMNIHDEQQPIKNMFSFFSCMNNSNQLMFSNNNNNNSISNNNYFNIRNLLDLPQEIIVLILGYLNYKTIALKILLVNRYFKVLGDNYIIWRILYQKTYTKSNKKNKYPTLLNNNNFMIKNEKEKYSKSINGKRKMELMNNLEYKKLFQDRFTVEKNWNRGLCSVQTLYGHQEGVWGVQFHGDTLVSASEDGILKVWDLKEGECMNTLLGHQDIVNSFHFDRDRVISGSDDSTLKMWDVNSGRCLNTFTGHQGSVWMLEFRDNHLISGGDDRSLRLWDINTGQLIQSLEGHTGRIYYVQMGTDMVVSGAQDRSSRIWDLRSGKAVHVMQSSSPVHCLQIYGNLWQNDWALANGHNNGSISVWNIRSGSLQAILSNPVCCPVWHIQFRKNTIYTSSCNDLHAWNLNGHQNQQPLSSNSTQTPTHINCSKILKGHTKSIKHFQIRQNRLVSGGLDNKIKIWDLEKPGNGYLYTLIGHTKSVDWLEFKNDRLISCSADHTIRIWDFYEHF